MGALKIMAAKEANSGWNKPIQGLANPSFLLLGREPIVYADLPVFVATHPSEMKSQMRIDNKAKGI